MFGQSSRKILHFVSGKKLKREIVMKSIDMRDQIEWGTGDCVILGLRLPIYLKFFSKKASIPRISIFFYILCMAKPFHAIKSSTFTKMDEN